MSVDNSGKIIQNIYWPLQKIPSGNIPVTTVLFTLTFGSSSWFQQNSIEYESSEVNALRPSMTTFTLGPGQKKGKTCGALTEG